MKKIKLTKQEKKYVTGVQAFLNGNYKKTVSIFEKLAKERFFPKQGSPVFGYTLFPRVIYDSNAMIESLHIIAALGYAAAQYQLGMFYLDGKYVQQNQNKGASLLTQAVDQGWLEAVYPLGLCYLNGCGVEKDPQKAFHLFVKIGSPNSEVAENNFAMYELGKIYEEGVVIQKNIAIAARYYAEAQWGWEDENNKPLEALDSLYERYKDKVDQAKYQKARRGLFGEGFQYDEILYDEGMEMISESFAGIQ